MTTGADVVTQVDAAAAAIMAARDVTLLAHVNPDADALGSALALGIAVVRSGRTARVAFAAPSTMPETLRTLDTLGLVVPPQDVPVAPELLVTCDAAEPARLGSLAQRLDTAAASVMIDHHASNPGFGDVRVLDPGAEATVVLVRRVLAAMDAPIDLDIARCLYAGLVTDTRGFRTAGPAAHRLAAELLETGLDPELLVRPMMDTHPFSWLATFGDVLARCVLEPDAVGGLGLVHTTLRTHELARLRQEETDTVVDEIRTAGEAEVAAVLKQIAPDRTTVSLRSKGLVDVADVAGRLGGGGHRMAAGFTVEVAAPDALAALRSALADTASVT